MLYVYIYNYIYIYIKCLYSYCCWVRSWSLPPQKFSLFQAILRLIERWRNCVRLRRKLQGLFYGIIRIRIITPIAGKWFISSTTNYLHLVAMFFTSSGDMPWRQPFLVNCKAQQVVFATSQAAGLDNQVQGLKHMRRPWKPTDCQS